VSRPRNTVKIYGSNEKWAKKLLILTMSPTGSVLKTEGRRGTKLKTSRVAERFKGSVGSVTTLLSGKRSSPS